MSRRIAAKITGVSGYVPPRVMSNADLEKLVETDDAWIRERTGIRERHVAEKGVGASDLATAAARQLLACKNVPASEIDLIVVASVTPDMMFPATACLVQNNLGATHAWGFDLSAACSGFLYALTVGAQFVGAGTQKKALVIGSDVMTSILDYKDRATCVLFGDGAGAVLLEPTDRDDEGILDFVHDVDGSGGKFLFMPGGGSLHPASHETVDQKMHYVHQEGAQVFKYAVRRMADLACEMLERNGLYEQRPGAGCAPSGQPADHSRHAGAARRGRRKNHGEHRSLRKYDGGNHTARAARCRRRRPAQKRRSRVARCRRCGIYVRWSSSSLGVLTGVPIFNA